MNHLKGDIPDITYTIDGKTARSLAQWLLQINSPVVEVPFDATEADLLRAYAERARELSARALSVLTEWGIEGV